MERLSDSLFDHIRSYLRFRELHANRVLSSRWEDIAQIPKMLLYEDSDPPAHVNLSNITRFYFHPDIDFVMDVSVKSGQRG